jgi:hypothetical protein
MFIQYLTSFSLICIIKNMSDIHNITNIKSLHEKLGDEGLTKHYKEKEDEAFKNGHSEGIKMGILYSLIVLFVLKFVFKWI